MREIVKNLESEVTELKSEMSEVKAKDVKIRDKVNELEDQVAKQDSLLFDLLKEKNERTAAAANFEFAPMGSNQSAVTINGLPSSCGDLKVIGHIWSGFYSIAGSTMMESVYCNFTQHTSDPGK